MSDAIEIIAEQVWQEMRQARSSKPMTYWLEYAMRRYALTLDQAHARNRVGMTVRQRKCLAFAQAFEAENGVMPSYQQIADELGLTSKSGVHRIMLGLEERGYIVRKAHRARGFNIVAGAVQ